MDSHSSQQQSRKRALEDDSPAPGDHEIQPASKKTKRETAEDLGTKDDPVDSTHDDDPTGPATPQSLPDLSANGKQQTPEQPSTNPTTREQDEEQKPLSPASGFHTVFPSMPAPSAAAYIVPDHIQRRLAPTSSELARAESDNYAPGTLKFRREWWHHTTEFVDMTRQQWEGDYFELEDLPLRQPRRPVRESEQAGTSISETDEGEGDEDEVDSESTE